MFGVLWLEWFLAYVTEHSLWLNRCYKFATQLRYCFLRAIDNYWSSFHTYYAVGPARGIDRIQETVRSAFLEASSQKFLHQMACVYILDAVLRSPWSKRLPQQECLRSF